MGAEYPDVAIIAMGSDGGSLLPSQLGQTELEAADALVFEDPRSEETFSEIASERVYVADPVATTVASTPVEQFSVIRHA